MNDLLVQANGDDDLVSSSMDQIISRLRRCKKYEADQFTGWSMGSKDSLFYVAYDKGQKLMLDGATKLDDRIRRWGVSGLQRHSGGLLTVNDTPIKIWRHEWRFNSRFLHKARIENFDDFLKNLPELKHRVYHKTVLLKAPGERSRTGKPRKADPIIPHWRILQQSCTAPSVDVEPIEIVSSISNSGNRLTPSMPDLSFLEKRNDLYRLDCPSECRLKTDKQ